MQISRSSSSLSIVSRKSGGSSSTPGSKHQSFSNLYSKEKEKGVVETCAVIETVTTHSNASSNNGLNNRLKNERWKLNADSPPTIGSLNLNERQKHRATALREPLSHASSAPAADAAEISGKFETQLKNPRAWSPVRSVGSVVGTEAHPESDSAVFESESAHGSDAFLGEDDDHNGSQFWTECAVMWSCVATGAVTVDTNNIPNWFNEHHNDNKTEVNPNWRNDILGKLKQRQESLAKLQQETHYEKAVELTSWIKTADARYHHPAGDYDDCVIELEWVSGNGGDNTENDSGTFTVLSPDGSATKIQFALSDITCVQCCSEPGAPRLAIHAVHLPINCSPVKLQFAGDADMEDWLSHLSSVCSQINMLMGKPASNAIWLTSDLGDTFVFDAANMKAQQLEKTTNGQAHYVERMDVSTCETPYYNTLYNG